jgi:SpoIID/LytB domain protein
MKNSQILQWISDSLSQWSDAAERHRQVAECAPHVLARYDRFEWKALLLPARKVSTLAKLDAGSVAARPCFLCRANRPKEQVAIAWRNYEILVNPFPIFPNHLTIAAAEHTPQMLDNRRIADMAALADELESFTVIYNGAKSGASAPDHFHFQAVPSGYIDMLHYDRGPVYSRRFIGKCADEVVAATCEYIASLGTTPEGGEMPLNLAMERLSDGNIMVRVVPRRCHRPSCYPNPAISPGAIDIFGTIVTVNGDDFNALNRTLLETILSEVAYPNPAHCIRVGIMESNDLHFTLHGNYERLGNTWFALDDEACFTIDDVPVGSQFHWEHTEQRTYPGTLELQKCASGTTMAVNVVGMERYLEGVIGAEMSPQSPVELLKAHAVISRGWAYKQIRCRESLQTAAAAGCADTCGDEHIKWYDHDDHTDFDVCDDDHCQRYLGLPAAEYASKLHGVIEATAHEVMLDSNGELCDTRFSKCCGGAFEEFEYCWEPVHHSYLEVARDAVPQHPLPDLRDESNAREWILSVPEAYCASPDVAVLRNVLNRSDFDTTPDFYRWTVTYSPEELSAIVRDRSGIDFGTVTDLQPVERGKSGRIVRLRIVGTLRTMVVGKELEIRRWLSRSHLYSSAFVVERGDSGEFILRGAGWGHGVGLCQIGAAVMASRGIDYRKILYHYFANATLNRYDKQ